MNSVSSIIVLFRPDIQQVLDTIHKLSNSVNNIILVDNTPLEFIYYQSSFSNLNSVFHIILGDNFGIASAQNIGIDKAKTLNSSYCFFLDQDSNVGSHIVPDLLNIYNILDENKLNVGVLSCAFIDSRTNERHRYSRLEKIRAKPVEVDDNQLFTEVDSTISSGSLIRTKVLSEVGNMLEELFIDCVDTEWCLRARMKGYSVYIANHIYMVHTIGAQVKKISDTKYYYFHSAFRNYFILRNNLFLAMYSDFDFFVRFKFFLAYLNYIFILMKNESPFREVLYLCYLSTIDAIFRRMDSGRSKLFL